MDLCNQSCLSVHPGGRPFCVAKHLALDTMRKRFNHILLYLVWLQTALISTIYTTFSDLDLG